MNKRIKELAKAYLVHERYTRYGEIVEEDLYEFYPDELEKFAALIVEECANVADENYIHRGSRTCGLAIRLHFGVE